MVIINFNFISSKMFIWFLFLVYGNIYLIRQFYLVRRNQKIEKEKIISLEDFLMNSNSGLINDNENKKEKDINVTPGENQSIEFQEILIS